MKSFLLRISRRLSVDTSGPRRPTDQAVLVAKQIRALIVSCTEEGSSAEKERLVDSVQCILRSSEDQAMILAEIRPRDLVAPFIEDLLFIFRQWVSDLVNSPGASVQSRRYAPCAILPPLCACGPDNAALVCTQAFFDSCFVLLRVVEAADAISDAEVSTVASVLSIARCAVERNSPPFRELEENLHLDCLFASLHPGLVTPIFQFFEFVEERVPRSLGSPVESGARFFEFLGRYSLPDLASYVRLCGLCLSGFSAMARFFLTHKLYAGLRERVMALPAEELTPEAVFEFAEAMRQLSSTSSPLGRSSESEPPIVVRHVNVLENLVSIFSGLARAGRSEACLVEILKSLSCVFRDDPANCNLTLGNAVLLPLLERFSELPAGAQTELMEIVMDFFSVNNESSGLYDLFMSKITALPSLELVSPFIEYLNYHLKDKFEGSSLFSSASLIHFLLQLYNRFFVMDSIWSALEPCELVSSQAKPELRDLLLDTVCRARFRGPGALPAAPDCYFKAFSVSFFAEVQGRGFLFVIPVVHASFIIHRFCSELSKDAVGSGVLAQGVLTLLEYTAERVASGGDVEPFLSFWLELPASFIGLLHSIIATSVWKCEYPGIAAKLVRGAWGLLRSEEGEVEGVGEARACRLMLGGLTFVHRLPHSEVILPLLQPLLAAGAALGEEEARMSEASVRALMVSTLRAAFFPLLSRDALQECFAGALVGAWDPFAARPPDGCFSVAHASLVEFLLRLYGSVSGARGESLSPILSSLHRQVLGTHDEVSLSASECFTQLMEIYVERRLPLHVKKQVLQMIQSLGEYGIPQDALVYWYRMVQNSNYPDELFECIMSITGSQPSYHYLFNNSPQVNLSAESPAEEAWIELPPFFSCSSLAGSSPADTKWETINGLTFSSWFCIQELAPGAEVTLLSLTGVEERSSLQLFVRDGRLLLSTREGEEIEAAECPIGCGPWFHVAFSLSKKKLNRSDVSVYVNGLAAGSVKCPTPSTLGHGGFIGSRLGGERPVRMRQGVFYLLQVCLSAEEICSLFALGPCYFGYFYGLYGNSRISVAPDLLTPQHYRLMRLDSSSFWADAAPACRVSLRVSSIVYGYSAGSAVCVREGGVLSFRMNNCQPNLEPRALIRGSAVPVRSTLLSQTLRSVSDGGILYCLTIIEGSKKASELNSGLVLLLRALHSDSWNSGLMDRRRGYFALSHLLQLKNREHLVNETTVRHLFAIVGLEEGSVAPVEGAPLNLNLHLLFVVFSYYVLLDAPLAVQGEFYRGCQSVLDQLSTHLTFPMNSEYQKRLTAFFLYPLTQQSFPPSLYAEVMKCIEGLLALCRDRTVLQILANFVVSTTSVHFGNTSFLPISEAQRRAFAENVVRIRDLLLEILLDVPESNCDARSYARVISNEWVFLILGSKKSPSSQHIALQIYRRLLLSDPAPILESGSLYFLATSLPVLAAFREPSYGRLFLYELFMMAWGISAHRKDYQLGDGILSVVVKRIGMKPSCPHPQFLYPIMHYMLLAYKSAVRQLSSRSHEGITRSIRLTIGEVVTIMRNVGPETLLPYVVKDTRILLFLIDILFCSLGSFSPGRQSRAPPLQPHMRRMRSRSTYDLQDTILRDGSESSEPREPQVSDTSLLSALEFDSRFAERRLLSDEVVKATVSFLAHIALGSLSMTGSSPPLLEALLNYVPTHLLGASGRASIVRMHAEIMREVISQLYEASDPRRLLEFSPLVSIIVDRTLLYCFTPQGVADSPLAVGSDYFPNGPLVVTHLELKFAGALMASKEVQLNSSQLSVFSSRFTDLIVSFFDSCTEMDSPSTLSLLEVMASVMTHAILPKLGRPSVSLIAYSVLSQLPAVGEESTLRACFEIVASCLDLLGQVKEELVSIRIGSGLKQNLLALMERGVNSGVAQLGKWMATHKSSYLDHIHAVLGPSWMDHKSEIKEKRRNDWSVQNSLWRQPLDDRVRFLSTQPYHRSYVHNRRLTAMTICTREAAHEVRANKNELHRMQFSAKTWEELQDSVGYPLRPPHTPQGDYQLDFYEHPSRMRLRLRRVDSKLSVSRVRRDGEEPVPLPVAPPPMEASNEKEEVAASKVKEVAAPVKEHLHHRSLTRTRRPEGRSNSFSFAMDPDGRLIFDDSSGFANSALSEASSSDALARMEQDPSVIPSAQSMDIFPPLVRQQQHQSTFEARSSDSEPRSSRLCSFSLGGEEEEEDTDGLMRDIPEDASSGTASYSGTPYASPFGARFDVEVDAAASASPAMLSPSAPAASLGAVAAGSPPAAQKGGHPRRRLVRVTSEPSEASQSEAPRGESESSRPSTSAPQESDFEEKVSPFIRPMDVIQKHQNCRRINGMNPIDALLVFTNNAIYTIDGFQCSPCYGNMNCKTQDVEGQEHLVTRWSDAEVSWIHRRKYELREVAMEVFMNHGYNVYLVFRSPEELEGVERDIKQRYRSMDGPFDTPSSVARNLQSLTDRWMRYEITNFEYLMQLNSFAGRSYSDLSQYMVFPWVLSDYTSASLDLSDARVYRDMSKPMGALNRETLFRERFDALKDSDEHPFHYGTHYSTGPIVNYYLTRLEPFASALVAFQNGTFDSPSRMFRSVQKTWSSSSGEGDSATDLQDVKELIPEFYSLPSFLLNINRYPLGSVNGEAIEDVELPPWAHGKAREFVRVNRAALESARTSGELHKWVDLIFGRKQRGKAAEEACNIFYYLTYEGAVDIEEVEDEQLREGILTQIHEFGQTPSQLFTAPHPPRPAPPPDRSLGNWRLALRSPIDPTPVRLQGVATCDRRFENNHPRPAAQRVGALRECADGAVCCIPQFAAFAGERLECYLAWGYKDRCVRLVPLCEPEGGSAEQSYVILENLDSLTVECCAFSSDSERIAIAYENRTICMFQFSMAPDDPESLTMEHSFTLYGHQEPVRGLSICPEFGILISYSSSECFVWDLSSARLCFPLAHDERQQIRGLSVSRLSGDLLLCTTASMSLFDVNGFLVCQHSSALSSAITTCELSLDSEYHPLVVTGHEDGSIQLWIVDIVGEDYAFVHKDTLRLHQTSITALSCSRCTLCSGDEEGQIVKWSRG